MNNPFVPEYLDEHVLRKLGFKSIGTNVKIDKNCTILGAENISIQDNVRIDGYCTIFALGNGYLHIGSYIHIGSTCHINAAEGIVLNDFVGLSQGVRVYSRTDDYGGKYMTNPTVPSKYTNAVGGTIIFERHSIVGTGSVILPKVVLKEGAAVGALSMVHKSLDPWGVYLGCPAKKIFNRSKRLLELEKQFLQEIAGVEGIPFT